MKSLTYRLAHGKDCDAIAALHAKNWQHHYRGLCPDEYLDHEVEQERLKIWRERFSKEQPHRQIMIVEDENNKLVGFVCTFLDEHEKWGAYLDNIHVSTDCQGQGIGKVLMKYAAMWVNKMRPGSKIYLHVLKENYDAIQFYERIGGTNIGEYSISLPWKTKGYVIDYMWDPTQLI